MDARAADSELNVFPYPNAILSDEYSVPPTV